MRYRDVITALGAIEDIEVRRKALDNFNHPRNRIRSLDSMLSESTTISQAINIAFTWHNSTEGREYWERVKDEEESKERIAEREIDNRGEISRPPASIPELRRRLSSYLERCNSENREIASFPMSDHLRERRIRERERSRRYEVETLLRDASLLSDSLRSAPLSIMEDRLLSWLSAREAEAESPRPELLPTSDGYPTGRVSVVSAGRTGRPHLRLPRGVAISYDSEDAIRSSVDSIQYIDDPKTSSAKDTNYSKKNPYRKRSRKILGDE